MPISSFLNTIISVSSPFLHFCRKFFQVNNYFRLADLQSTHKWASLELNFWTSMKLAPSLLFLPGHWQVSLLTILCPAVSDVMSHKRLASFISLLAHHFQSSVSCLYTNNPWTCILVLIFLPNFIVMCEYPDNITNRTDTKQYSYKKNKPSSNLLVFCMIILFIT